MLCCIVVLFCQHKDGDVANLIILMPGEHSDLSAFRHSNLPFMLIYNLRNSEAEVIGKTQTD